MFLLLVPAFILSKDTRMKSDVYNGSDRNCCAKVWNSVFYFPVNYHL